MDDSLKKQAYLEGMKLKKAGLDNEIIFARLEKQGFPTALINQVVSNITIQQYQEVISEQKPLLNNALLRLSIGFILALVCFIIVPNIIVLPIGFMITGIVLAFSVKSDQDVLEKAIKILPLKTIIENIEGDMDSLLNDYCEVPIIIVWYGAYHINPKHLVFWICVPSTFLKNQFQNDIELNIKLRQLLEKHNYPIDAREDVLIGFESMETIDTESNGNWYHHFK